MAAWQLWLSMLFSCIGGGYMLYGRRQREPASLLAGLALCVYPYFISNVFALVAIGLALMVAPRLIPL